MEKNIDKSMHIQMGNYICAVLNWTVPSEMYQLYVHRLMPPCLSMKTSVPSTFLSLSPSLQNEKATNRT